MLTAEEKEQFANENFELIYHMVNKFKNIVHIEEAEFVSAAHLGFARALNSFDESRKVKLSTYVCNCIEKEFLRTIRYSNCEIRKGSHEKEMSLDAKRLDDYGFHNVIGYLDKEIEAMDSKLIIEEVKDRLDYRKGLVLEKLVDGKTQREIAAETNLGRGCVNYYIRAIRKEVTKEWERGLL